LTPPGCPRLSTRHWSRILSDTLCRGLGTSVLVGTEHGAAPSLEEILMLEWQEEDKVCHPASILSPANPAVTWLRLLTALQQPVLCVEAEFRTDLPGHLYSKKFCVSWIFFFIWWFVFKF
jgi:hypothetical protein